jgi:hypothetical protein
MDVSLSVAARDRRFSKAMFRARGEFDFFFREFAKLKLNNPIHEALLIGVTDDIPHDLMEVVPNKDGYYQVLVGCASPMTDEERKIWLYQLLERVFAQCPFSASDKTNALALLTQWRRRLTGL